MPFINGRFYSNPAYGEALERARNAEASGEFNDEVLRPGTYGGLQFADPLARYGTDNDTGEPEFQLDSAQQHVTPKQQPAQKQTPQLHPHATVYPHEKKVGGSRSWRNNNPANITYGHFAKSHGATGPDYGGMAVFPTMEAGEKAQDALWHDPKYQALTIEGAAKRWTPSRNSAVQTNYIRTLSRAVGATPDTSISHLDSGQLERLKKAQTHQEGFQPGITKPIPHKP